MLKENSGIADIMGSNGSFWVAKVLQAVVERSGRCNKNQFNSNMVE